MIAGVKLGWALLIDGIILRQDDWRQVSTIVHDSSNMVNNHHRMQRIVSSAEPFLSTVSIRHTVNHACGIQPGAETTPHRKRNFTSPTTMATDYLNLKYGPAGICWNGGADVEPAGRCWNGGQTTVRTAWKVVQYYTIPTVRMCYSAIIRQIRIIQSPE